MSDGMLRAIVEAAIGAIGRTNAKQAAVQEQSADKQQDEPGPSSRRS
jgi:hypothetical protein